MNCLELLKQKGYGLEGYSPDTIVALEEASLPEDECEALLWYLEAVYG
ncbi:hypothetical protein QIT30_gp32 [Saccharolobus solfataricus rod-shaped virus 1]|uniref:Uncharacterized protein n=1 Tax=Saccharolobus solfataricus rod-shaped virus 1 TaxID=2730619 RepID=A0A6M3VWL0_SSRV1|nr:hypothetical protein QIT30_gp32 [Saccharolobus solfataricus rod-shaped virus 1]QJF12308.1 hypothetical protein SSRV1_gp32 [Saccharolobus solfataricus rod-shaped virus 1]